MASGCPSTSLPVTQSGSKVGFRVAEKRLLVHVLVYSYWHWWTDGSLRAETWQKSTGNKGVLHPGPQVCHSVTPNPSAQISFINELNSSLGRPVRASYLDNFRLRLVPRHDIPRGLLQVAQSALGFAFMLAVMYVQTRTLLSDLPITHPLCSSGHSRYHSSSRFC